MFERGFKIFKRYPHKTTEAVISQRNAVVATFKRYLWALGTVGSSAPFVGLFGTVVGILKAFQSLSVSGAGGGFKVVSQGIAAALVATAAGLLVAIYAIVAYNYFVARVNAIAIQYKMFCEEFLLALGEHGRTGPDAKTAEAGDRGDRGDRGDKSSRSDKADRQDRSADRNDKPRKQDKQDKNEGSDSGGE